MGLLDWISHAHLLGAGASTSEPTQRPVTPEASVGRRRGGRLERRHLRAAG